MGTLLLFLFLHIMTFLILNTHSYFLYLYLTEAQTLMIIHLKDQGVRTPEPLLNIQGELMSLESLPVNHDPQQNGEISFLIGQPPPTL